MTAGRLRVVPVTLRAANAMVAELHRHHKPSRGHKFSIAVSDGERIRGVGIASRPVARLLDDGTTLEVVRVCTDGCPNACSLIYGAMRRIAKAMGYRRVVTYTLADEGGASLRAAGWVRDDGRIGKGGEWGREDRPREAGRETGPKVRWSVTFERGHDVSDG